MEILFLDLGTHGQAIVLRKGERKPKVYSLEAHVQNMSARLGRASEHLKAQVLRRLKQS